LPNWGIYEQVSIVNISYLIAILKIALPGSVTIIIFAIFVILSFVFLLCGVTRCHDWRNYAPDFRLALRASFLPRSDGEL
jgi:hypothetical protein